jgi:AraC family transcriptional regulator, transcriptional activator of pobA
MKNVILNYGLYGDVDKALLPDFVHCEPLETRSSKYNWIIKQHLHTDLFQVFYYEEGSAIVFSENSRIKLEAPCLLIIPENTLHGFEQAPDVKGTVTTLSSAYLERLFPNASSIMTTFGQLQLFNKADNKELFEKIILSIAAINDELFGSYAQREIMLQSLFTTLFTRIYRLSNLQHIQYLSEDNRSIKIFKAFLKSIRKSITPHKTMHDYAKEQNITAVHLNRVCQFVAQKSASVIVQEYYISEAKKLLSHTSLTISEVAYKLNFEDAAYFSRYFKKKVGAAPKEFLKQLLK